MAIALIMMPSTMKSPSFSSMPIDKNTKAIAGNILLNGNGINTIKAFNRIIRPKNCLAFDEDNICHLGLILFSSHLNRGNNQRKPC